MDLKAITKAIGKVVREHIAAAFTKLQDRIDQIDSDVTDVSLRLEEARVERGEKGDKGDPGESITVEDVWPLIRDHTDEYLKSLPPAPAGPAGESVTIEAVEPVLKAWVSEAIVDLERRGHDVLQRAIDKIKVPKDGRDGIDADPQAVANCVIERLALKGEPQDFQKMAQDLVSAEVARIPIPKDGADGKDARPATAEEIHSQVEKFFRTNPDLIERFLEAAVNTWALDFEKRAQALLQAAIDKIPTPKDGADGRDGRDGQDGKNGSDGRHGLGLDDFDAQMDADGRTITLSLASGERVFEKTLRIPVVLDRGVWKKDADYCHGDGVTYSGSFWIAQRDEPRGKPGEFNKHWRLAVKRGMAGKSA